MEEVLERVRGIAAGAALMAGVEAKLTVQSGDYEMLVNMAAAKVLHSNLDWLGPIRYTDEEQSFARAIQRASGKKEKGLNSVIRPLTPQPPDPPGGSTDTADVSWVVPTVELEVTTYPEGASSHAWPVAACAGMSIGHKGLLFASKALAATMVDLFEGAELRQQIRAEFLDQTKDQVYKAYIPDGPPPVPLN